MASSLMIRPTPPKKALPWTVLLACLWMLTVDGLTGYSAGPVSLSGAITLGGAALCILLSPMIFLSNPTKRRELETGIRHPSRIPLVLTLFGLYIVVRVMFSPTMAGLQNVSVLITFVLTIGLTAIHVTPQNIALVGKWLRGSAVIASAIAILAQLSGMHIYGNRTFALAAIVFLALLVPHRPKNVLARYFPVLPFIAIALSLSRVALAISAVLFMFIAVRKQRGPKLIFSVLFLGAGAATLLNWIIDNYEPLRERFTEKGDGGLVIGGIAFNTSGRSALWDVVSKSAAESPMFGKGAGSATDLVTSVYGTIAHPHNDYLRVLHDYGYVGLGLFSVGYVLLILKSFKRALRSDEPIHWSAALGLAAVAVAAVTDNVVIYPYAMIPLGVIVGASMALPLDRSGSEIAAAKPKLPLTNRV